MLDTVAPVPAINCTDCIINRLVCYGYTGDYVEVSGIVHKAEFHGGGSIGNATNLKVVYDTLVLTNNTNPTFNPYSYNADTITVKDLFYVDSGPGDTIHIHGTIGSEGTGILALYNDTICLDYVELKDSKAVGQGAYYAGANSTDSGNNAGWAFAACGMPVSIPAYSSPGFILFPNPSSGIVNISGMEDQLLNTLRIFDVAGRLLYSSVIQSTGAGLVINLSDLRPGMYLVQLDSTNRITTRPLMITGN